MKVRNVGLMFSGGIDSTFLLCLLIEQCKLSGADLIVFTVENNEGYDDAARNILSHRFFQGVKANFGISNGGVKDGNIDFGITNVLIRKEIDVLFTGVNQNPEFYIAGAPKRPSYADIKIFPKLRCPFLELTKDIIVAGFKQLYGHLLVELLPLTHSCTNQNDGDCGNCFQCIEKRWALQCSGIN